MKTRDINCRLRKGDDMVEKKFFTEVVLLTKSYNLQDFKDWMHWHIDIIGFQRCHVFDNESSVDIKSECQKYGDRVTYELVNGWPNQYALYNRYINNESPAWWVLPIDDDEFLYVSDKYKNNINVALLTLQKKYPDMVKLSMSWKNMFPLEFTKTRTKSLIENATGWSDKASEALFSQWRQDNRWVKTAVNTMHQWYWGLPHNGGHNPSENGTNSRISSYMCDGTIIKDCTDNILPPRSNLDMFVAHYQFKSDDEWRMKCSKRKSAANQKFDKNKPCIYNDLYKYKHWFIEDKRMVTLWK